MKGTHNILLSILIFSCSISGCKKLVEVDAPVTSTNGKNVFTDDGTASAVLTSIYAKMSQMGPISTSTISTSVFTGLSSDELTLWVGANISSQNYYLNALTTSSRLAPDYWSNYYPVIYSANAALEGLANSKSLTPLIKQQLTGEAQFIRAFSYFYLVNLYGAVPLAVSTDYEANRLLSRSSKVEVWKQIIADLKDAQNLLSDKYLNGDALTPYEAGFEERVRPTKWAATALLARVYLYSGDDINAEAEATKLINNSIMYSIATLADVFKMNNTEAIWQLQPVNTGWNTEDARAFIIPTSGLNDFRNPVYLSNNLLNSFEIGDQRKSNWVDSVTISGTTYKFPYKYKSRTQNNPVTEYLVVLRLAEQYLIRAEARANQTNIAGAQADLNVIRVRAALDPTTANDKSSLLTAIFHERQVELFTEWGHRWFDLNRTNTVDAVMTPITNQKGGTWQTTDKLYPIPLSELQKNPKLVQNPGY